MDPFNSETWKQQWAAFWRAPFIMLPLILVAVVVTWQVIEAVHGTEIAGKDATIEALREEVTSYKNKLSGASPDQAKAQIDEAKAKIDGLEARLVKLEPRTLSAKRAVSSHRASKLVVYRQAIFGWLVMMAARIVLNMQLVLKKR